MTPRILDELGEELVRAARADDARRRRRVGWLPRTVTLALGGLLLLAAAAFAATLVIGRGDPIPPAPEGQVPEELQPEPGTAQLNELNVADPDGGPPWDVRTSRSKTGATCITIGQVLDGELGLVGLDRRFRALPAGAADTCSTPQKHGATLAGARAFRGGGRLSAITVVNGVAAPDVGRVVAAGDGRTQRLKLGPGQAFLAIFRGTPEQVRPRVTLIAANGERTVLRFADTGEYLAPDPSDGAPWTVKSVARKVAPGLRCVQAARERGPDSPTPLPQGAGVINFQPPSVPLRCGKKDAAFADVWRFVPFNQRHGNNSWWGLNAARTIAWGAVPRTDTVVMLRAPGKPRRIAVDPRTHGFAVILDGKVDPRSVRLTVDGTPLTPLAGVTSTQGRPVKPRPAQPPAWRSVASVVKRVAVPNPFLPDRASARIVRRADDPTGGEPWALRAWSAGVDRRVRVMRPSDRRLLCFQIGHPVDGDKLTLPGPQGGTRTLGFDERNVYCNPKQWLANHAGGAMLRVELDDPTLPDPTPLRTVVAGLLGPGVRSAELLGAGAPRPLELGPDGTFLLVLPGAEYDTLRVRQTRDDGSTRTGRSDGTTDRCRLQPGHNVQLADPDGGPPWVVGYSRVDGHTCTFSGRVVAGRPAYIVPDDGTVSFMPETSTGAAPTRRSVLGSYSTSGLALQIRGPGMDPTRTGQNAPPAAPQVARRTLPGRTVVTGFAPPDVVSVTIRTPRDVRTVTPVDGLFMAVYDGAFYTGEIVATGHRRDGTTVTERRPTTFP